MVFKGEKGTKQQVITKFISEKGLYRIKEFTDIKFKNLLNGRQVFIFEEAIISFFRAISYENILFSLFLEIIVDTIYNFLFGPLGRRVIKLFIYAAFILKAIVSSSELNVLAMYIEASLIIL